MIQRNYIMERLKLQNMVMLCRTLLTIFVVMFVSGVIFFLFSRISRSLYIIDHSHMNFLDCFLPSDNSDERFKNAVMVSYFSFTTLSTVGFGDLVFVSDPERVFGCVFLLFGVTLFSYIG